MIHPLSSMVQPLRTQKTDKNTTSSLPIDIDRLAECMTAALKILHPGTTASVRVVKRVNAVQQNGEVAV